MLKTFTLKNGIKVATYNLPNLRSFYFKITVKGGSIIETDKNHGLAHFMEHMLVQGIPSFPTAQLLSDYIENLAGTFNATTSQHSIGFQITVPSTHVQDAVKITSEVFFEPLFPQAATENERRAVIEEVKQDMDSTGYRLSKFFRETRFRKKSPLIRTVGGSPQVLNQLQRQDFVDYWKTCFVPENTYILAIGKFNSELLFNLLNNNLEGFQKDEKFPGLPKFNKLELTNRQVAIRFDRKLKSNYIDLSFPSLHFEHSLLLRIQQHLLLRILANLRSSRLFRLLRYQLGLVYGVGAATYTIEGLGYVNISSETSNENLEQVVLSITQELASLGKNGPTEKELAAAKEFLANRWLMSFDHPSSIATWIENDLLWEDKIRLPEELIQLIKDTTVNDLVKLMQKYWDFSKINLTVQGGIKNTKESVVKLSKLLAPLV